MKLQSLYLFKDEDNGILCPYTINLSEEKLAVLNKNDGRNLRKSHRAKIPLPGLTYMQLMLRVQNRATKEQFTQFIGV